MKPIVTLTLNPSIDSSCETDVVRPIHKIRTSEERYDPGGGGINVARVIRELGGQALAVYLAGGMTGDLLGRMVDGMGLPHVTVGIGGSTRVSHVVYERSSGREYRFTPSGPPVTQAELDLCLMMIDALSFDFMVASGSLAPGSPIDFYAKLNEIVVSKGARLVVDTSGPALSAAIEAGVFFIKPSLGELESAVGRKLREPGEAEKAAVEFARSHGVGMMAVTMGGDGAILATSERAVRLDAPPVEVKSAVGAGDSFVGAMTYGLASGRHPDDAFALAVASGTATVITAGTDLCLRSDVERLYEEVRTQLQMRHSTADPVI